MSLDIKDISPRTDALVKDPVTAVFLATNERYNDARNKLNHQKPETIQAVQDILKERFSHMDKVAKAEASYLSEEEIRARVAIVVAALHEEAESCVNHGMLKDAADYLRASHALVAMNNAFKL